MQIEPPWLVPAISLLAGIGVCLLLLKAGLRWWRQRLAGSDLRSIRARISEAAPEPAPPTQPPVLRHVPSRDRSSLAQRTRLASSFVGRDANVEPV